MLVLIESLTLVSHSSSFSIHLSTYKNQGLKYIRERKIYQEPIWPNWSFSFGGPATGFRATIKALKDILFAEMLASFLEWRNYSKRQARGHKCVTTLRTNKFAVRKFNKNQWQIGNKFGLLTISSRKKQYKLHLGDSMRISFR